MRSEGRKNTRSPLMGVRHGRKQRNFSGTRSPASRPEPPYAASANPFSHFDCLKRGGSCSPSDGAGPHSGIGWAWFGGHGEKEIATLTQPVTLEGTLATLSFFLSVNRASIDRNGAWSIYLDDTQLFSINDGSVGDYEFQDLDISDFADGLTHILRFEAVFEGTAITNFFVDDIMLQTCAPRRPTGGERVEPEDDSSGTGVSETGLPSETETGPNSETGARGEAGTGGGSEDAPPTGSDGESGTTANEP